jgi:formate dehydrogenase major subunit
MERIAQRIKETRDRTFTEIDEQGRRVNRTMAIGSLGGATFGIEENYLLGKLMHSAGVVSIENQARI